MTDHVATLKNVADYLLSRNKEASSQAVERAADEITRLTAALSNRDKDVVYWRGLYEKVAALSNESLTRRDIELAERDKRIAELELRIKLLSGVYPID